MLAHFGKGILNMINKSADTLNSTAQTRNFCETVFEIER